MNLFPWKRGGKMVLAAAPGEIPEFGPDPRVGQKLQEENLEYTVDEDGLYKVYQRFTQDGRNQWAYVTSRTMTEKEHTARDTEWRKVYPPSFTVEGALSQEQANELLADTDRHVFGSWCIEEKDGKTWVKFQVAVDATALSFSLRDAIELVCIVADDMEKKIAGRDGSGTQEEGR